MARKMGSRKKGLAPSRCPSGLVMMLSLSLVCLGYCCYDGLVFTYKLAHSTTIYSVLTIYKHVAVQYSASGGKSHTYSLVKDPDSLESSNLKQEFTEEDHIPAIIHHFSRTDIVPTRWHLSYSSCLGIHKRHKRAKGVGNGAHGSEDSFEFILWTDAKIRLFIEKKYPHFLSTFDSYPQSIQRVDAGRYFILRHFGGIYMDLDVGCRDSLDQIRRDLSREGSKHDVVLPVTEPLGVSNDFMIASRGSHFMTYITEKLTGASDYNKKSFVLSRSPFFQVLMTTGPLFLSVALFDYGAEGTQPPGNSSSIDKATAMSQIALMSNSDYTKRLLYHKQGGSWHSWDGRWISYFFYTVFPTLKNLVLTFMLAVLAYVAYNLLFLLSVKGVKSSDKDNNDDKIDNL